MPTYGYNRDYPFAALITNLGKYNEGELIGEWVKFPTTAEEIKRLTKYAVRYEDEFLKPVMGSTQKTAESECKQKQKELSVARARDDELDGLFERIYEDNLSGKLSDGRFSRMSQRYEAEQLELKERMKTIRTEIEKLASESVSRICFSPLSANTPVPRS